MSLIRAAAALAALVFLLTQGHTALHSSQSPEPPVTPDWLQPSAVWHFSMGNLVPCAWCDTEQFYEDIDQSGATVAGFMDFRWWQTNWRALAPTVARNARERGLHPLAALSQVGWWPESDHTPRPSDLESAVALDPYGNRRQEDMGGTQGHVVIHSALEPGWEAYLTASAQTFIDAGFEGLVIDDGAYVGDGYDFRPALLDEFNTYLAATRPASELDALAQSLGFSSFSQFDYAQVWRDRLPADTTALTDEVWNTRWDMHIPLWEEFDGFRRLRTHEVMGRIFTNVKSYARENYGREIPTAFNLSELPFSALPFLDLIDYVDLEASYSTSFFGTTTPEYFPSSRRTADIKLLDFLGLSAKVVTLFGGARVEIASRGTENTALYRTLIADAYASGGLFYVEEKAHDIDTDFGAIAPWYRFVAEHPEFFDPPQGMTNVAILQLWEQYEGWPKPALLGAAAILADDGWQFDVVLSGEDIQPEFPGFNRLASLETLQRYPVLVIPRLEYCWTCTSLAGVKGFGITANHAQLLLDYVESGGSLLVFASRQHNGQLSCEGSRSDRTRVLPATTGRTADPQ